MPEIKENKNLRVSPNIVEAEAAVLGCILINSESMSQAMQIVDEKDFYNPSNATIYENMLLLFENNKTIDYVSVIEQLKKNNKLKEVGDAYYITGLTEQAPSTQNVEYYAKLVKEKSILRNIINVASNISNEAYQDQGDVTEILDKAEQTLFSLSKDADKGRFKEINPILHDVLDNWSNRKEGSLTGVPSSFFDLDNMLSGFQKSDLIILAGRPSMGKTALALNFARNIAVENKLKVGFFSLEMSSKQLVERLITSEAQADSHLVRTGKLPKNEWRKLSEAASILSESNVYIDDSADLNIMELRAKARQLKADKDIDILFIDYIQLLHAPQKSESRQQEISYISRSLKALAKELDIPIVALSQLSRAVESRTDHRPIMSDLRESGAIEQDADVVMFIYRKYVYSKSEEDEGLAEIILSKHRNGPTGTVKVSFIDKYAKFDNLDIVHSDYEIPS
ncbi:MAG: replicative DNA helicase [Candidatus Marinimicrobia bacterium]|nr:replicative DNA helicase [Candidatus Neomarinimicrobiota bacterium]|tara:strand:- start:5118 stop:6476 length:1359 start_codon:yes stop_codon:yes gene_type:complete